MAFKLDKKEREQKALLETRLTESLDRIVAADPAVEGELAAAIETFNGELAVALDFINTVAGRLRDEFDAKSEKWRDSDAAADPEGLINEWEGFSALSEISSVESLTDDEANELRDGLQEFADLNDDATSS